MLESDLRISVLKGFILFAVPQMPGQPTSMSQQFGGMPGQMQNHPPSSGGIPGRPGMPMQPPGPSSGPISSPMQQPPKRIDPDQMPNPVCSDDHVSNTILFIYF